MCFENLEDSPTKRYYPIVCMAMWIAFWKRLDSHYANLCGYLHICRGTSMVSEKIWNPLRWRATNC